MAAWKKVLLEGDAAVLSSTAPVNVSHAAASAGTATEAARQDHKHGIDAGVVGDIKAVNGAAAALGTAVGVSHVDHVHPLGPLVANLDFAQNQALQLVIHGTASAPGTAVVGQLYYNTTDSHPYVYT